MSLNLTTYSRIKDGHSFVDEELIHTAESEDSLKDLYKHLEMDYSKFYKMDELSKLGLLAVELILQKRADLKKLKDDAIAMVFQSENGCLQTDVKHQSDVTKQTASPAVFVYTLSNIVCGETSIKNKWYGESVFFIEKSSELKNLHTYSKSLILSGKAELCIVARLEAYVDDLIADCVLVEKDGQGPELSTENLKRIFDKL